jgi:hypothetical protein
MAWILCPSWQSWNIWPCLTLSQSQPFWHLDFSTNATRLGIPFRNGQSNKIVQQNSAISLTSSFQICLACLQQQ